MVFWFQKKSLKPLFLQKPSWPSIPTACESLETVLRSFPQIQVVITSSWREVYPFEVIPPLFSPDIAPSRFWCPYRRYPPTAHPRFAVFSFFERGLNPDRSSNAKARKHYHLDVAYEWLKRVVSKRSSRTIHLYLQNLPFLHIPQQNFRKVTPLENCPENSSENYPEKSWHFTPFVIQVIQKNTALPQVLMRSFTQVGIISRLPIFQDFRSNKPS